MLLSFCLPPLFESPFFRGFSSFFAFLMYASLLVLLLCVCDALVWTCMACHPHMLLVLSSLPSFLPSSLTCANQGWINLSLVRCLYPNSFCFNFNRLNAYKAGSTAVLCS
ncbi:unnamed protein product [Discosporangium mesarthrocarpum]